MGGNDVTDNGSSPGTTNIDIVFDSMNPIWLHFENELLPEDDIFIGSITNNTGIAWTDFHFEFTDAIILAPINITPLSGQLSGVTGDPSSIWLLLDPPETVGFSNGQGIIDTSISQDYWLHIAPTAVPVPAAVWLFGSGLIGLIRFAKRRRIR